MKMLRNFLFYDRVVKKLHGTSFDSLNIRLALETASGAVFTILLRLYICYTYAKSKPDISLSPAFKKCKENKKESNTMIFTCIFRSWARAVIDQSQLQVFERRFVLLRDLEHQPKAKMHLVRPLEARSDIEQLLEGLHCPKRQTKHIKPPITDSRKGASRIVKGGLEGSGSEIDESNTSTIYSSRRHNAIMIWSVVEEVKSETIIINSTCPGYKGTRAFLFCSTPEIFTKKHRISPLNITLVFVSNHEPHNTRLFCDLSKGINPLLNHPDWIIIVTTSDFPKDKRYLNCLWL